MFIIVLVEEILIPALESAINGIVKLVQTKEFWITVALLAAIIFCISAITGLSLREVTSIDHISNLWGLAETGSSQSPDGSAGDTDKYRGGATPYDG